LNHAEDLVQQRAVFQNEQVRIKDTTLLSAHAFTYFPLDFKELLTRLNERPFEPIDFFGHFCLADGASVD